MRIALAGFHIECCTFSPLRTSAADFHILRGSDLLDAYPFTAQSADAECVPLVRARALPGGPVVRPFYDEIKRDIVDGLRARGPWDGVFLDLHGAAVVEGIEDAEADLVEAIRAVVGPKCLIAASYDLHGNVSERLVAALDILTAYRTAPHVDIGATEERAWHLLLDSLRRGCRPVMAFRPVSLLVTGEQTSTDWEPGATLYAGISDVLGGSVQDASLLVGYAWADEPRVTAGAVALGTSEAAVQDAADTLAHRFWAARDAFDFGVPTGTLDECVHNALHAAEAPVVISDSGDNITAGAPGDLPLVLKALLLAGASNTLVAGIPDAPAVTQCFAAGTGNPVKLALGGKLDAVHASPLPVEARVRSLHTPDGSLDTGVNPVVNRTAVVEIAGVTVILTERRTPFFTLADFTQLDIEPSGYHIIVVKMGYLSPELATLASRSLLALSPGAVNQNLAALPYKHIRRPIFPLDSDTVWSPSSNTA